MCMGTLEELGCSFESKNGVLSVKDGIKTLMRGKRYEKLYILQGKPEVGQMYAIEKKPDDTVLCNRRLRHMSQKNLDLLVRKGLQTRRKSM